MNVSTFKLKIKYDHAKNELDYTHNCIMFLKENIDSEIKEISKNHRKQKNTQDLIVDPDMMDLNENEKQSLIDEYYSEEYFHFESISKTLIESIFIRQISIVEKYLVGISFDAYRHALGDCDELIPPNFTKKDKKKFSDCKLAVKSINKYLSVKVGDIKYYSLFINYRELRHKLAHGESYFHMPKEDMVKELNREFDTNIIIPENDFHEKNHYKFGNDYNLFIELNTCLEILIRDVKVLLETAYNS